MTSIPPPPELGSSGGLGTTDYLGNVAHARIPDEEQVPTPSGALPTMQGYKKGDQIALLPTNGQDLATLQQALYQAGYLTDAQYKRLVLGSPDEVTTTAFAKLLATANMSGVTWKDALSARLAIQGSQPQQKDQVPPLTIQLSNPDDIKAVAQKTAQTLYGGNLPDADLNNLVTQYQAAEKAYQTAQYYQQYDPTAGGYGPGGEATKPASADVMTENYVKTQHPEQYQATQFGTLITDALDKLRTTGYL